ncbi:MAG TPA: TonB C-terminal domain-containing protein [Azospirillum sp.]
MREPLVASAVLHTALIALIVLGLPPSDRKLDIPQSIPIEIVDIGEITEAARVDKGEPKPEPPKPPVPEAKPAPPPPEPVSEPPPPPPPPPKAPEPPKLAQVPPPPREPEPPKRTPEPPPPPPPPPAPTPEPAPVPPKPPRPEPPKPEPPKPEPPKPEPPKPEPPKAEPPKPEPPKPPAPQAKPKPEPPKEPPKEVAKEDPLAKLLGNVQKLKPSDNAKADAKAQPQQQAASAPAGAAKATSGPQRDFKPSGRAIDAIRSQVSKNWNFDPGRKDAGNMAVEIRIEVAVDGTVLRTDLSEDTRRRALSDSHFRAAAESALRAINRTQKLDLLPSEFTPETYEKWRTIVFAFDPRDM